MQIVIPTDLSTVPGLAEAVELVRQLQDEGRFDYGASITTGDIVLICAAVLAISRPAVQAELLADISDHLNETGHAALARLLDDVSDRIRKALR